MNILVICHYGLYSDLSFSFVHNQIREYAKLGHKVRAIIPNGVGKVGRKGGRLERSLLVSEADGVELYDVRYVTLSGYGEKGFNTRSAVAAIQMHWNRIFRDFVPDVVHAHTLGFISEIGTWIKERFSCPLIVTTHGSDTVVPLECGRSQWLKQCCDKADAVVAVSNQLRERVAGCGTNTRLLTIHNGFVMRQIPAGNVRKPRSMIQVCNLVRSKNVDVTIRAFAVLKERYPDMTLTIVGQGPLREELEALCKELKVSDCVEFTGQLPNDEAFLRMCQSEFFVMVSKPEGFGIVYLEAMAAGCVTIGTEGQGIADVIVNGENGFLVNPDSPSQIVTRIEECLLDLKTAKALVERGSKLVRSKVWSENAICYVDLFARIDRNSGTMKK